MKIKIKKNVNGELYYFYGTFKIGSTECTVRKFGTGNEMAAKLTKDKKRIIMDEPIQVTDKNSQTKTITEFKIPKYAVSQLVEYLNQTT
jgi:hypothetical protein